MWDVTCIEQRLIVVSESVYSTNHNVPPSINTKNHQIIYSKRLTNIINFRWHPRTFSCDRALIKIKIKSGDMTNERCSNDANVYEACLDSWRRCFEYRHKEARVPRRATRGVLVRQRQSDRAIIYRGRKEQNKYWATPRGQRPVPNRLTVSGTSINHAQSTMFDNLSEIIIRPRWRRRRWLLASLSHLLIVVDRRRAQCFQDKLSLSTIRNRRNYKCNSG